MSPRKSLAWSFSLQFGQYIIGFAGSVVVAHLLTPHEMGIFALAMSATYLLSSLQQVGIGDYLIREPVLTEDKIRTTFGVTVLVSWALGTVLFLSRGWVAEIYHAPGISAVLSLLAINFCISPLGQIAGALLTRDMRFDILHNIGVTSAFVGTATGVALVAMGFSYMGLAWGLLVTGLVRVLLLFWVRPQHVALLPSLSRWREIVHFGGYLTGTSIAGTLNVDGVKFILAGAINPAAVALFERSVQIPSLVRQGLFAPIGRVLLPTFSKSIRDGKPIGPGVRATIAASTVIVWPVFLSVGILSTPIIVLLFGDNWRVAGEIMPYILLGNALLPMLPQPENILIPHGRVKRLFKVRAATAILSLAVTAAAAHYGLQWFAKSRVLIDTLYILSVFMATAPYLEISAAALSLEYLRASAVAILCAIPALWYRRYVGDNLSVPYLLGIIATSGALWLIGIVMTRHILATEIFRLIGRERRQNQA